jgi:hypothetical protein
MSLPNPNWNVVAFEVPTAAKWSQLGENDDALADGSGLDDYIITNAKLSNVAGEPGGAWNVWTTAWTNLTKGTSFTENSAWIQIGKTVHFRVHLTLGTSPSVGTNPTLTLPVAIKESTNYGYIGQVYLQDTGSGNFEGRIDKSGIIYGFGSASTYVSRAAITATVPHTWAATDVIRISGTYEAA